MVSLPYTREEENHNSCYDGRESSCVMMEESLDSVIDQINKSQNAPVPYPTMLH